MADGIEAVVNDIATKLVASAEYVEGGARIESRIELGDVKSKLTAAEWDQAALDYLTGHAKEIAKEILANRMMLAGEGGGARG